MPCLKTIMASVQPVNDITKPGPISTDSGDESDDAYDDVIEVSPCKRWEKRRIEVSTCLCEKIYINLLVKNCIYCFTLIYYIGNLKVIFSPR